MPPCQQTQCRVTSRSILRGTLALALWSGTACGGRWGRGALVCPVRAAGGCAGRGLRHSRFGSHPLRLGTDHPRHRAPLERRVARRSCVDRRVARGLGARGGRGLPRGRAARVRQACRWLAPSRDQRRAAALPRGRVRADALGHVPPQRASVAPRGRGRLPRAPHHPRGRPSRCGRGGGPDGRAAAHRRAADDAALPT